MEIKHELSDWLKQLQDRICSTLEQLDGGAQFTEQRWDRAEGGGGRTRVISDGDVIEKGGVLFSAVHGIAPDFLIKENKADPRGVAKPEFYATGVSIVLHPKNPFVPIIHMNIRYFEMDGQKWLGGGIDVTPHYINKKDAAFFHRTLKEMCDKHNPAYYNRFKKWADDYFFLQHRQETRGIGGIFFDRLHQDEQMGFAANIAFWKDVGELFTKVYSVLVNNNRTSSFNDDHKRWQLIRRGRYVEFNLLYDKGTKFGLESNGRVESILMSLPKTAGWEYDHHPEKDSEEYNTQQLLRKDISWIDLENSRN
jgi:coproporphyrinogen III oxidase